MTTKLYLIHALSPIHCGTGQGTGGIDLPIARERGTGVPFVPGSSLKGVLRSRGDETNSVHTAVFGAKPADPDLSAGSVQVSDATLAFLPVRALRGTFAWVTSPYLLTRLARAAKEAGFELGKLPAEPGSDRAKVAVKETLLLGDKLVLEDLAPTADVSPELKAIAEKIAPKVFPSSDEQKRFVNRVALVDEDTMSLLMQAGMEITARNRIDENTHVVAKGALWTEEALPVESILAGVILTSATPKVSTADMEKYVAKLLEGSIQLGGKATVGRGLCRVGVV